jgi:hypothetical protein
MDKAIEIKKQVKCKDLARLYTITAHTSNSYSLGKLGL